MKKVSSEKSKVRYNMFQNSAYMINLAWRVKEKKVIFLCLMSAFLAVSSNLVTLYVTPTILGVVEHHAPIQELLLTVFLFVGAMMVISAAKAYVNANKKYGCITVRVNIISMFSVKNATTSYCNLDNKRFQTLYGKAIDMTNGNDEATEAIW